MRVQPKLAPDLSQLLFLLLGLLDAIAVLDPLVVLPAVGKETEQKNPSQCRHDDVITMAFRVALADHAIVDDPFFKMDFNGHQLLSHARNFALRARGLPCSSFSFAATTFLVRTDPATAGARNFCLTIRSSSE